VAENIRAVRMVMGFIGACEHNGRFLVAAAFLVTPASQDFQAHLPIYLGFFEFVHNAKDSVKFY
jgi:hypothetical protein